MPRMRGSPLDAHVSCTDPLCPWIGTAAECVPASAGPSRLRCPRCGMPVAFHSRRWRGFAPMAAVVMVALLVLMAIGFLGHW
jgi:hypothetical protein